MPSMFDMYRQKKKKVVDPNAPPRPSLLGHEKVLKDAKQTIESQARRLDQLDARLSELERKVTNQAAYISALHHRLQNRL